MSIRELGEDILGRRVGRRRGGGGAFGLDSITLAG